MVYFCYIFDKGKKGDLFMENFKEGGGNIIEINYIFN